MPNNLDSSINNINTQISCNISAGYPSIAVDTNRKKWLGDYYYEYLKEIQHAVSILIDNGGPLPYFTPHDSKHCKSVENIIYSLFPD